MKMQKEKNCTLWFNPPGTLVARVVYSRVMVRWVFTISSLGRSTGYNNILGVFEYIKDDKGYIIGSIVNTEEWWCQSCDSRKIKSWSDPIGPYATRQEAIDVAIADFVSRRIES